MSEKFEIEQEAIDLLIRDYCREAGVRQLNRNINQICEKIAFKLVQIMNEGPEWRPNDITNEAMLVMKIEEADEIDKKTHIVVSKDNLEEFIGDSQTQS